jgi:DNA-binding NarL/FixJ family response regulator
MSPSARVRVVPPIAPYTASIDDALVIAAALAGAGAVISKSSAAAAVLEAIRELARSPRSLPQIPAPLGRDGRPPRTGGSADPGDAPGRRPPKIARALELAPSAVSARIENMIARLESRRAA